MMDRHLNKLYFVSIAVATFTLLLLFLRTPQTCLPPAAAARRRFPRSSCDSARRVFLPLDKKNKCLWSSRAFRGEILSYRRFFDSIRDLGLLRNHSKVLCVSAGASREVMALSESVVADVTGVELIDSSPPLVSRADPHDLPFFFDGVFDLAFSGHLEEALFPSPSVAEMERTVRVGGACVVVVEECGDTEVEEIVRLFRKSRFLGAVNVTLIGLKMTRIVLRVKAAS